MSLSRLRWESGVKRINVTKNNYLPILTMSLLVSVSSGSIAVAQQSNSQNFTEDEIIVTAQRREQNILEVPLAVTAYSGDFLDNIGVDEFDEIV